ncbi:MAG: hypothetical protein E7635_01975 [Ruminococcaceae bacterium]|nr:hypothetical protein [Oscillospiraceae bacterium]
MTQSGEVVMYYRLVKGNLLKAPENISRLIGKPTRAQYLFFGYKPVVGECDAEFTYVEEDTVIRRVSVCDESISKKL